MKHEITKDGYSRIIVNNKHYLIHRLVFQTWGDEDLKEYYVIDHIDANVQNNHILNLRQVTQKENISNAINHGNFGHNRDTKLKVTNNETNETKIYDSIKDFLKDINAPNYIIKHGCINGLSKRKEYKKYSWTKINKD